MIVVMVVAMVAIASGLGSCVVFAVDGGCDVLVVSVVWLPVLLVAEIVVVVGAERLGVRRAVRVAVVPIGLRVLRVRAMCGGSYAGWER